MKYLTLIITLMTISMATHLRAQTVKKALLVIDLQENLLNPASTMHADPASIGPLCTHVNEMIKQYHDNGWPVLYVVNEWTNPILNWFTGNVVKKGAQGTGIDPRIDRVNSIIYTKSVGDAFSNKDLLHFLKDQQIEEITLTGVFSDACIKQTARSGLKKGYKMTVVEDAVGARNAKTQMKTIHYFREKGITVSRAANERSGG